MDTLSRGVQKAQFDGDPAKDLTVIVLTQRLFESPQAPQVHLDLQQAAYAALL
jgi:hypothetical protein